MCSRPVVFVIFLVLKLLLHENCNVFNQVKYQIIKLNFINYSDSFEKQDKYVKLNRYDCEFNKKYFASVICSIKPTSRITSLITFYMTVVETTENPIVSFLTKPCITKIESGIFS